MSYDEAFYEAARRAADKERGKMYEPEPQAAAIQQHAAAIMVAAEKIKQGLDGIARTLETDRAEQQHEQQTVRVELQAKGLEAATTRIAKAQEQIDVTLDKARRYR